MTEKLQTAVREICREYGNDRTRMLDIVRRVQAVFGCVSSQAMDLIAREVGTYRVEVESVVSFYAFLSKAPRGRIVIRKFARVIDHGDLT